MQVWHSLTPKSAPRAAARTSVTGTRHFSGSKASALPSRPAVFRRSSAVHGGCHVRGGPTWRGGGSAVLQEESGEVQPDHQRTPQTPGISILSFGAA